MSDPYFSICIPNYNYARYIGRTISSVLAQRFEDFEIVISDNASTDGSVETIRSFADPRVKLHVNRENVGFTANLDRAGAMASGLHMIMLSSDDVMLPEALVSYAHLLDRLAPAERERTIVTSPPAWIDGEGNQIGRGEVDLKFWKAGRPEGALAAAVGAPVFVAEASDLLRRALALLRNPLPFAPTCYPRALYRAVEGYGGGRMINPDKWFGWKLLGVADKACLVDAPLFQYRWHSSNQTAQQSKSGSLKHLVDQYANTIEIPDSLLAKAGLIRQDIIGAFVEEDIALRNLERVAEGQRALARRGLNFGLAAYPAECARNWKVWALRGLLLLGPLGSMAAWAVKDRAHRRWAHAHGALAPQQLRAK